MLRSIKALQGYAVLAQDGDIGKVHDFYFQDDTWAVRYVVVDTGHWLPGRKVLLTRHALSAVDWEEHSLSVVLSREQVKNSPNIDTAKPVSRQHEVELHSYYGWPMYWIEPGPGSWPMGGPMIPTLKEAGLPEAAPKVPADPHLRSAREVIGYHLRASDGVLGRVEDFIGDDACWLIRYLVAHVGGVLSAKKALLSPRWLEQISCDDRRVEVDLTREEILKSPPFRSEAGVDREYEERIYDYYGRPAYWAESQPAGQAER